MSIRQRAEEIVLHFDDELGVFSAMGSGIAGAGLAAIALGGDTGPGAVAVTLVGLALIVLDYFR